MSYKYNQPVEFTSANFKENIIIVRGWNYGTRGREIIVQKVIYIAYWDEDLQRIAFSFERSGWREDIGKYCAVIPGGKGNVKFAPNFREFFEWDLIKGNPETTARLRLIQKAFRLTEPTVEQLSQMFPGFRIEFLKRAL